MWSTQCSLYPQWWEGPQQTVQLRDSDWIKDEQKFVKDVITVCDSKNSTYASQDPSNLATSTQQLFLNN